MSRGTGQTEGLEKEMELGAADISLTFPGGMEGQKRSVVSGIRNKQNPGKMLQFDPVDPRVEAAA
jgi:hypothetical protein